jgi:hypothetical protein
VRAYHLTTRDKFNLGRACQAIADAFGHHPYLVGSVHDRPDFRDVDVRLILDDDEFDALFAGRPRLWSYLCSTIANALANDTGLPIDFQIQRMTEANTKHQGQRSALGLSSLYAGGGDATPSWDHDPRCLTVVGPPDLRGTCDCKVLRLLDGAE